MRLPLCVCGVGGGSLKRRIEEILIGRRGFALTPGRRAALALTTVAAVGVPVLVGAMTMRPQIPPQPVVDSNLRFEVASVKRPDPTRDVVVMRSSPGRFEALNVSVRMLLRQAFGVPDDRVIGAPGWIVSERYTVVAKAPDAVPSGATPVMLANLLRDRFKLATHSETRQLPVFHLVLARRDRRLGPKLKASSAECQALIAARRSEPSGDGRVPLPGTPGGAPLFDPINPPCGSGRGGPGIIGGGGQPISWLVTRLSQLVGSPVVDDTALAGLFDFVLTFTADSEMTRNRLAQFDLPVPIPVSPPAAADSGAPTLYAALQDELGLKLETRPGAVQVVVVDRIERPTEN